MQNSKSSPFRQGVIDALVFFPVLAPFSALFGIFARDVDLSFLETMGFSITVFAGASQFAALSLLHEGAPILIAILAGFTLNMRFFLYSATLAPHFQGLPLKTRAALAYLLVDQSFVLSDNKFDEEPHWSASDKARYFFGVLAVIALPWHAFTVLGYYAGTFIPESINIAFALPLSFIALIMPAIKSFPHVIAALISIAGTIALRDVPNNFGLIISGLVAIFVAAQIEKRQKEKHQ